MSPRNRRILFSLALLIWSGVILYFYASGRITRYLAPDFRFIALCGGLGLAVLGLFNLLTAGQQADCGHDHGDGDAHDHESGDMHPLTAFLLMVVPVVLSVAWTKDKYSEAAISRKTMTVDEVKSPFMASMLGPITREDLEKNHRKTEDGYYEMSLMELFFSSGDAELQKALGGMKVQTEGRWAEEKAENDSGTRKRLYRMFITCCAADSRAIPIVLEFGKEPPEFPDGGWVRVSGTITFPTGKSGVQPVLEVEQSLAAEEPYEENFMRN
jgi:uncharacterized repeat protein (TIGR03943 family)